MRNIVLTFSECEHYEDLSNYKEDVRACGGVIESSHVDTVEEIGSIECNIPPDFWDRFKTTNAYEFLEGI